MKSKTNELSQFSQADLNGFASGQLQEFLDQLLSSVKLCEGAMEKMNEIYTQISLSNNSEVKFRWIRLGLKGIISMRFKWNHSISNFLLPSKNQTLFSVYIFYVKAVSEHTTLLSCP